MSVPAEVPLSLC